MATDSARVINSVQTLTFNGGQIMRYTVFITTVIALLGATPVMAGSSPKEERVGVEADVDGLNPTTSVLTAPGLVMANAVFETLTDFDTDGNAVPYLARSIEPAEGETFPSKDAVIEPGQDHGRITFSTRIVIRLHGRFDIASGAGGEEEDL